MTPSEARMKIRKGEITTQTSGMCNGYAQANLCILPKKYAYDFLLFASRNQTSCPILEVLDEGSRYTRYMADHADIATDIIGCSFSFEGELLDAEVPIRHIEQGRNVPMFLTNIPCEPAGIFHGNMVVSMRPIPYGQVVRAVTATAAMPKVHGAPVHIGDPALIGIADITKPDFGDSVEIHAGDVPVFWPCGVTPQAAIMAAKPELAITHAPGHMFLTDVRNSVLKS